jgi:polyphosphate:AMP phosphotransferase
MLETVDLKARLGKADYRKAMDRLDLRLGEQQRALREAGVPVLILLDGWDAAGKGTVLSRILQPLDPRGYKVVHVAAPGEQERMFPPMRRFWLRLPARGRMSFFDHSWYRRLFEDRLADDLKGSALSEALEQVRVFERQLVDDGAAIVKFFFHISKNEQAKRLKKLTANAAFAWKAGPAERARHKSYKRLAGFAEELLRETSTAHAPWNLIPAENERAAIVAVAETLSAAFDRALAPPPPKPAPPKAPPRRTSPLDRADLTHALSREKYEKLLPKLQAEARRLQGICYQRRRSALIVYEGWDAAGKGGNIRRLIRELDPRGYEVVPFAAPEGDEKTHHYLWRFWRALPKGGHWHVFDRSHYGRVLVERVEGFASPDAWGRAYREINEFEQELTEAGTVVVKFWLHISKAEELRRFRARARDKEKQWKLTDEDWRNREKWPAYWEAVSTMIERTSTIHAPWTIIEAEDKLHARVQALKTVIERVGAALGEKAS